MEIDKLAKQIKNMNINFRSSLISMDEAARNFKKASEELYVQFGISMEQVRKNLNEKQTR